MSVFLPASDLTRWASQEGCSAGMCERCMADSWKLQ